MKILIFIGSQSTYRVIKVKAGHWAKMSHYCWN